MAMALGYTIAELQNRMTVKEVLIWASYREKYGAMNDIRRYDRPAAMLGSIISHANGGKSTMLDLMPFKPEELAKPQTTDFSAFVAGLGKGAKIGKRKRR
jgi:hypothetical protein